jgi:hypothetical protein
MQEAVEAVELAAVVHQAVARAVVVQERTTLLLLMAQQTLAAVEAVLKIQQKAMAVLEK